MSSTRMLEMAHVKSGDVIYDIGSGDGRIIIQAAKKYGVRGVGIEIDPDLVQKAGDNAFREKVDHLVEFRAQDAFTADVSPSSVVTLYMLHEFNAKLRPLLEKEVSCTTTRYFCLKLPRRAVELSVYPRIRREGKKI